MEADVAGKIGLPHATKFQPRNKMILIEAIDDPLAPKDDPKKLKIIREAISTGCGVVVAAAADCSEWVKPGAVVYHPKDQGMAVLLEEGKLYGLVHEELLLGNLPPGSVPVKTLEVHPTAEDAERRLNAGRQPGLMVPTNGSRRH